MVKKLIKQKSVYYAETSILLDINNWIIVLLQASVKYSNKTLIEDIISLWFNCSQPIKICKLTGGRTLT